MFASTTYVLPLTSNLPTPPTSNILCSSEMSDSDILQALALLDPTKGSGLNNIGPNLLKHCSMALATLHHHLCNISSEWKSSNFSQS